MRHEVACDSAQARFGHHDMDAMRELALYLVHLIGVKVGVLDGLQELVVDFGVLN